MEAISYQKEVDNAYKQNKEQKKKKALFIFIKLKD